MIGNPKIIGDHLNAVIAGWDEHADEATFSGLTLAQFKLKVKPSLDARIEIEVLERQLAAARVNRELGERRPGLRREQRALRVVWLHP